MCVCAEMQEGRGIKGGSEGIYGGVQRAGPNLDGNSVELQNKGNRFLFSN